MAALPDSNRTPAKTSGRNIWKAFRRKASAGKREVAGIASLSGSPRPLSKTLPVCDFFRVNRIRKYSAVLLGLVVVVVAAGAEKTPELQDVHGKTFAPLSVGDRKAAVLVFVSPFCPTSNTFTPEVNDIAAKYGDRFSFYFVEADAEISSADAKKHADTFEMKAPVLLDPKQVLARRTGAKTTPEAVVIGPSGETLYQGRINDLYVTQTRKLKEPKTHDLRVALDAIAAGRPVDVSATKAIGCSITLTP